LPFIVRSLQKSTWAVTVTIPANGRGKVYLWFDIRARDFGDVRLSVAKADGIEIGRADAVKPRDGDFVIESLVSGHIG
jgi:hypothetical protein